MSLEYEGDTDDLRRRSQADQGSAWLADHLPPLWRRMYENCMKEGFDEEQSLTLIRTYILSTGSGDKRP